MTVSEKRNLFLFLGINTLLACFGMFYYILVQPESALRHVLPSYFFAVLAVYLSLYATKPEAMIGFFAAKRVKIFVLLLAANILLFFWLK